MEEEKKELQEQPVQPEKPEDRKKEADSGMILGMCIGLAMGAGIGAATKNLGLWMPIGMCLGIGMAFDSSKKNGKKDDGDADPQA